MTYAAFSSQDLASLQDVGLCHDTLPFDLVPSSPKPIPQAVLCAAALTLSASVGLMLLYGSPFSPSPVAPPSRAELLATAAPSVARTTPPAAMAPLRPHASLFDPTPTASAPVSFARSAPLKPGADPAQLHLADAVNPAPIVAPEPQVAVLQDTDLDTVEAPAGASTETAILPPLPVVPGLSGEIPLPAPRPAFRPPSARVPAARLAEQIPASAEPSEQPSFFEKVFGGLKPSGTALAYATPEDGGGLGGAIGGAIGGSLASRMAPDRLTAVYDIAAHTVTLPDGTRMEAHSGLGLSRDDPRSVTERMRGATPPNLYELTPREAIFHGVRALRLTPTGGTTFGRAGLLAHTYMLGPHGDSNGCVVFKNYKAFLDAYESGRVRRLAVVARAG